MQIFLPFFHLSPFTFHFSPFNFLGKYIFCKNVQVPYFVFSVCAGGGLRVCILPAWLSLS